MRRYLYVLVVLCVFPFRTTLGDALADEESGGATGDPTLQEIVISATRTQTQILDAPGHVSVITARQIEDGGAGDLAELLSTQAGIDIIDRGPVGALQTVSIRGANASEVLVLIDGVRMNDSRAGGIDLSLIPLGIIDRIEIVRGGTSALYGADAVGGIINIITKKRDEDRISLSFENGSYIPQEGVEVSEGPVVRETKADAGALFDMQKVGVGYSGGAGKAAVNVSGSFTTARNAYVFDDPDYGDRRLVNAELSEGSGYASVSVPGAGGQFGVRGFVSYARKGAPGSTTFFSTDETEKDGLAGMILNYKTDHFLSDATTLDATVSYKYSSLEYEDPDPVDPLDDRHILHSLGLDAVQELLSFQSLSLIYGFNVLFETSDSTEIGRHQRSSGGLFVESPLYLSSTFTLTPAIRFDYYSDFPDTLNFKLSGVRALSPSSSFKAELSSSYRAPTLNDLYWPYSALFMVSGNPDLKAETAYSADAGVTKTGGDVSYDLYGFLRLVKDEIKWTPNASTGVWLPENIGRTLYPGIEAGAKIRVVKKLWFTANSTFIYSFVLRVPDADFSLGDDKRVPYVPVSTLNTGLEYSGEKTVAGLSVRAVSKQYTDAENTSSIDGFAVLNGHLEQSLSPSLTLTLAVDNILNATYSTSPGYVMPPLFIRTGVKAEF